MAMDTTAPLFTASVSSTLTTGDKATFVVPFPMRIIGVIAAVGTAPKGKDLIFDVNKGGSSIFEDDARPTVKGEEKVSALARPKDDAAVFDTGDTFVLAVDQVGDEAAGADASVTIWAQKL